jgi:hypothetical protein
MMLVLSRKNNESVVTCHSREIQKLKPFYFSAEKLHIVRAHS